METILFIVFLVAVALLFGLWVVETRKQHKRIRAWEDSLLQVELNTNHLFHEVNALKADMAHLAKQIDALKKPLSNHKLVVIETELALPKFAKPTTTEQPAKQPTEKKVKPAAKPKEQQPQAPADKPQTKENKFSAAFAATHRTQYIAYRKQGLSIRAAGAKAGVSKTTACRYERWAKRQK